MEMIPPPAPIPFVKRKRKKSVEVCEAEVQLGEACMYELLRFYGLYILVVIVLCLFLLNALFLAVKGKVV